MAADDVRAAVEERDLSVCTDDLRDTAAAEGREDRVDGRPGMFNGVARTLLSVKRPAGPLFLLKVVVLSAAVNINKGLGMIR